MASAPRWALSAAAACGRWRWPAASDRPPCRTFNPCRRPDFESSSWYGATVPGQTPDPMVRIVAEAITRVLHQPDIMQTLVEKGADVIGSTPGELAAYMKEDTARWKKVIDEANIKAE